MENDAYCMYLQPDIDVFCRLERFRILNFIVLAKHVETPCSVQKVGLDHFGFDFCVTNTDSNSFGPFCIVSNTGPLSPCTSRLLPRSARAILKEIPCPCETEVASLGHMSLAWCSIVDLQQKCFWKCGFERKNGHIVVPLQILKFRDLKFRRNHLNLHPVWLIITARIRRSSYTFFSCVLLANSPAALWTHRSLWLHLDMNNWSHIYYHHDPSWSIMIYYESFVDAFRPLGLWA